MFDQSESLADQMFVNKGKIESVEDDFTITENLCNV